mmetsp:Transcript_80462/g.232477  ORF Transcript_80462/g.232477 Transcript_80462/m.232477 type:complete len:201 (-) Transcript_80462:144-746(-)
MRSAISFTRFRALGSLPVRAARPRCNNFTSAMCAFRISVIIATASAASWLLCPASRFASSSSFCRTSACSRPFRNSASSRCACALKASFFAEATDNSSCSARTFRASLELFCIAFWNSSFCTPISARSLENSNEPQDFDPFRGLSQMLTPPPPEGEPLPPPPPPPVPFGFSGGKRLVDMEFGDDCCCCCCLMRPRCASSK